MRGIFGLFEPNHHLTTYQLILQNSPFSLVCGSLFPVHGGKPKMLWKIFYYEDLHAKIAGKGDVEVKKQFFSQLPFGYNMKVATSAEFESPILSVTWNSELCYFFQEIFGYPS